jgi:MoaA/NifB/PqqE/SkfB family radical SAM enzyme
VTDINENNKARFCISPFVALNTRGQGNPRVCCSINGLLAGVPKNALIDDVNAGRKIGSKDVFNLTSDSIESFWNSAFMRDFRMKMIRGEYIKNCQHCHALEDKGMSSKRLSKNSKYLARSKELIEDTKRNNGKVTKPPVWWEIRLSTICNLACRMCSPFLSSRILSELRTNRDRIPQSQVNRIKKAEETAELGDLGKSVFFREQVNQSLADIETLEMRGGEVLSDPEAMRFLESVSQNAAAKNIHFDLSSNITLLKDKQIEMFNNFKGGHLRCSIDGYAEENEYIRHGSNWNIIIENLKRTKKLHSGWYRVIQTTLTAYQILTIDRLVKFIDEFCEKEEIELFFGFSTVRETPYLVHELIPLEFRLETLERIDAFIPLSYLCNRAPKKELHRVYFENVRGALKSTFRPSYSDHEAFRSYTKSLDTIRQQNVLQVFPHLHFLFEPELAKEYQICLI